MFTTKASVDRVRAITGRPPDSSVGARYCPAVTRTRAPSANRCVKCVSCARARTSTTLLSGTSAVSAPVAITRPSQLQTPCSLSIESSTSILPSTADVGGVIADRVAGSQYARHICRTSHHSHATLDGRASGGLYSTVACAPVDRSRNWAESAESSAPSVGGGTEIARVL